MDNSISRAEASAAVGPLGWRHVLGTLTATVPVDSLAAAVAVAVPLAEFGDHLRIDLRADRVVLTLRSPEIHFVSRVDVELAGRISALVPTEPFDGAQIMEIAIDTLDRSVIRPFWRAVLAYEDEPGGDNGLVDPLGRGPAVWFQQMDAPRPQRNRIHLDVSVAHDVAEARVAAAVAAGGRVVSAQAAPSFWVLADAEGNEACVTTWQGRD